MKCSEFKRELIKSQQVTEPLRSHAVQCPDCAKILHQMTRWEHAIIRERNTAPDFSSITLWPSVSQKIVPKTVHSPAYWWAVPAAAILLLSVLTFRKGPTNPRPVPSTAMIQSAKIDGQPAQISLFTMPEKETTFVWLDT